MLQRITFCAAQLASQTVKLRSAEAAAAVGKVERGEIIQGITFCAAQLGQDRPGQHTSTSQVATLVQEALAANEGSSAGGSEGSNSEAGAEAVQVDGHGSLEVVQHSLDLSNEVATTKTTVPPADRAAPNDPQAEIDEGMAALQEVTNRLRCYMLIIGNPLQLSTIICSLRETVTWLSYSNFSPCARTQALQSVRDRISDSEERSAGTVAAMQVIELPAAAWLTAV